MKKDHLYFIQSKDTGHIKIGRSVNPQKRIKALQTGSHKELRLIAYFEGLGWREPIIHRDLDRWRVKGEWFEVDCVGSLPVDLYEKIPFGAFDEWWK
jgi:hypothetical protein